MAWISTTSVQLCLHISIFFTFACIDLQFCKEAPDPCCLINHGLAQLHMRRSFFFSFACIDLKYCRQPPDLCHIINHGLDLNYKVSNCACADPSFLVLHVPTCSFVDNLLNACRIINHAMEQLCMRRSIFFSFASIDLKFCKQPPDHCRIINHSLDLDYKVRNCTFTDLSFFSFTYIDLKLSTQLLFCSAHNFAGLGMQFPN